MQFETTFGVVGQILTDAGVGLGQAVTVYHRVIASDGTASTEGPAASVVLTRDAITNTDAIGVPTEFALHGNFPNPFNPTTTLRYDVAEAGLVKLEVFDMLGRKVATLVNNNQPVGRFSVSFDAVNLSSGVYLYRLEAGQKVLTQTMTLLK